MTIPHIQTGFSAGEISPSVWGHVDLAKYAQGASTFRNCFVNYRGGASSRAGLAYVLACKQQATQSDTTPPRNIPFQFNINQSYILEFGDYYMRIVDRGAYVVESSTTITAATRANPLIITDTGHGYSNGDWIYIQSMTGMTQLNNLVWIVKNKTTDTYQLTDLFGNTVNSTNFGTYVSGGTAARIYTIVSPYAVADLPYLKYTQSADTMTMTCVNQETGTDYAPYNLVRNGATDWSFSAITFASSIDKPTSPTATPYHSTTQNTYYNYVITAVNSAGEESVPSDVATCFNNDISINAGSNVISWAAVTNAVNYNIYSATPIYTVSTPSTGPFGYIGTTTTLMFTDSNIIADFTRTPPIHTNPFPSTGNYPGVVGYYQQRRVYANTIDNPDTYYMSQPGAYDNMDVTIPVIDSNAIVGTPWSQQINGIQAMVTMNTGLIVLTGSGTWVVNGGSSAAITPSSQQATAQSYIGCSPTLQPIVSNINIIYVQAKGSIVRDLSYNFYTNIFVGEDKTILANHLFNFRQIQQWCYAEEPYKVIWAARNDGTLLSMTYLKEQDIYGWARHDTNGLFVNVSSITEPPIDAVYAIVKRYIAGENKWMYYQERFDNRNWDTVEDCFCVDAGLRYSGTNPNSTLIPAAASGTNNISAVNLIAGGSNYSDAVVAVAFDESGKGSDAAFSVTVVGGVITAVTPTMQGMNYQPGTIIQFTDSTGSGAIADAIITNNVVFRTSSSVFNSGMVGNVIRIGNNNASSATTAFSILPNGGGRATITSYVSATEVIADITEVITNTMPDDPNNMPVPVYPNQWSISVPITVVSGLNHLEGMEVAINADGSIVPNQIVTGGKVTLPQPASAIVIGLPFIAQVQTLYLNPQGTPTTTQGKRKGISAVTVRVESSRGVSVGVNQPDQSTQPDNASPVWTGMTEIKQRNALITAGNAIPLFTGDERVIVSGAWDEKGQVAVQQTYALPLNLLAVVPEFIVGDDNG